MQTALSSIYSSRLTMAILLTKMAVYVFISLAGICCSNYVISAFKMHKRICIGRKSSLIWVCGNYCLQPPGKLLVYVFENCCLKVLADVQDQAALKLRLPALTHLASPIKNAKSFESTQLSNSTTTWLTFTLLHQPDFQIMLAALCWVFVTWQT